MTNQTTIAAECDDRLSAICTEHPVAPDTPTERCPMCEHNRRVLDKFNSANPPGTRIDYRPDWDSPPDLQRITGRARNCNGRLLVQISGHPEPVRLNHLYNNHLTAED